MKKFLTASIALHIVCTVASLCVSGIFLVSFFIGTEDPVWLALIGIPVFGEPFLCLLVYFCFCIQMCIYLSRIQKEFMLPVPPTHGCIDERPLRIAPLGDAAGLLSMFYLLSSTIPGALASGIIGTMFILVNAALRLVCIVHIRTVRKQREAEGSFSMARFLEKNAVAPRIVHKKLLLALIVTGIACVGVFFTALTLYNRHIFPAVLKSLGFGNVMKIGLAFLRFRMPATLNPLYILGADIGFVCIFLHCVYGIRILSGHKFFRIAEPWFQILVLEACCGLFTHILLILSVKNTAVFAVAIAAVAAWALHFAFALAYAVILLYMRRHAPQKTSDDALPPETSLSQ